MNDTAQPSLPSKRDLEHALRGAGLSAKQAKRVLADGYRALGINESEDEETLKELLQKALKKLEP